MDKEQWNQFVIENKGCFLQSWQWAEFQKSLSRKIWLIEKPNLKSLVIKHDLPLNKNYLYCSRGPVGQGKIEDFLAEVKEIAQKEKSIFFKIEPGRFKARPFDHDLASQGHEVSMTSLKSFTKGRALKNAKEIQPSQTIILDISQSEEELLKQIHQKTRYNLRLAQKKGVVIEQNNNQASLDIFLKLSKQTAQRDKFHLHDQGYYQKMLEILGSEGMVKIFLAKYQGRVIAANLICFFGQIGYYLHGASDYDFRNLMAPYLLQWQVILLAKEQGFKYYDFWGINQQKWPGVTRFKRGFGGQEISCPGAFDLVYHPVWYGIYNLARKVL